MKKITLLFLLSLSLAALLAACAPQQPAVTQTPDFELIETIVAGTVIAEVAPVPTLLGPADGTRFDRPEAVVLSWDWVRPLADGQAYDVRVWREGAPHYGITWTQEESMALVNWLAGQEPGQFFWSVAVVETGAEGSGESSDFTPEAAAWSFSVDETAPPTPTQTLTPEPTSTPVIMPLEPPPGFLSEAYSTRLSTDSELTIMEFGPDGHLYVVTHAGEIFRLIDSNNDAYAETIEIAFADREDILTKAVGIAFRDGLTYISDEGRISTIEDLDGDGIYDAESLNVLVDDLPAGIYTWHSNNEIEFGPDGKLYVGVGATSDHGPLRFDLEASILRMNPDGSDLEVFATGLRNPYGLTFTPDGDLFTADNNPDQLAETLRYLPPEELNHIREGLDYGFPHSYGNDIGEDRGEKPVVEFFPSVASSGLTYQNSETFPEQWRGIYVAQWGSAAEVPRDRNISTGHAVIFVRLEKDEDGRYSGDYQNFARPPWEANFRPVDVAVGPDGALYIAEWLTSQIYRIAWIGEDVQADLMATRAARPTAVPSPSPTFDTAMNITPAPPIEVTDQLLVVGEAIYRNGMGGATACVTCHSLDGASVVGPSMIGLSEIAGQRMPGLDAENYVRLSIRNPSAYIVPGYEDNLMPKDYAQSLNEEQIDALIAFILSVDEPLD